jgi:hypothetical protein
MKNDAQPRFIVRPPAEHRKYPWNVAYRAADVPEKRRAQFPEMVNNGKKVSL